LSRDLKILLYGYGNPGRKDDGVGPALVELVGNWIIQTKIKNINIDSNYQLNIEDAYIIRGYDIVIFVDASIEDIDNYILTRVEPSSDKMNFTMHSVSPSFVLDLCRKIYKNSPETYLLHIKGYEFELQEGFSNRAEKNLSLAFNFIKQLILKLKTE
jgi:hydrogenase maturation protease